MIKSRFHPHCVERKQHKCKLLNNSLGESSTLHQSVDRLSHTFTLTGSSSQSHRVSNFDFVFSHKTLSLYMCVSYSFTDVGSDAVLLFATLKLVKEKHALVARKQIRKEANHYHTKSISNAQM